MLDNTTNVTLSWCEHGAIWKITDRGC